MKIEIETLYTILRYFKKNPSLCEDAIVDDVFKSYEDLSKYLSKNKINTSNFTIEFNIKPKRR